MIHTPCTLCATFLRRVQMGNLSLVLYARRDLLEVKYVLLLYRRVSMQTGEIGGKKGDVKDLRFIYIIAFLGLQVEALFIVFVYELS